MLQNVQQTLWQTFRKRVYSTRLIAVYEFAKFCSTVFIGLKNDKKRVIEDRNKSNGHNYFDIIMIFKNIFQ